MVGSLENAGNPFAGIVGVESTTVVPAPVQIMPLVMKKFISN